MAELEYRHDLSGYEINPDTHPIFLQEFEWNEFVKLEQVKPPLLHKHKWVYRLHREMGEVFIVGNAEVSATLLCPARYCPDCRRVEFKTDDEIAKHTKEHWSQLDMIALGFK